MSYPRRGKIEPVKVQNVKRTTVQKSTLPDTPIIKQTTRTVQPTRTGLVLPNKSLTAERGTKPKTAIPDERKKDQAESQTLKKSENVDKIRSEKSTLSEKVVVEKSASVAAKKEKDATEASSKPPEPEVGPDPVKLKEQKDLIQEVNKLLRELEGVWGSEDLKVLQKHCVTTVQHFKFARESMIQQLTDECKSVDRSKTIPELIKQVTEKTQKQRQEIEKMKSAHGKHLVHCQQISLDKMEAEFRAKYERLNDEKKKLILDKFNLSDQVNELEEYKSEFGDRMRIKEKEWNEERNNLEKNLRIVSKELSRVEREENKKSVEFDKQLTTLKKQLHEAEAKLGIANAEKRLSDKRIEGLMEKLKDVNANDQELMLVKRERDKMTIKVDDLENEIKSLQDEIKGTKNKNEETEKELAMTRIQKKNVESEISLLKKEMRQKRVTIKLELKEQGIQTVPKCEVCMFANGRCNCPFSQLHSESVSKGEEKPASERKKTTKSRKGRKSSKKLYTKSHMNVTKMGASSEYGIEEDQTQKDDDGLAEDADDSSMAYTMRGKYEVHKQSLQLDTSQYLTPKEFSYPLEKLLRETHAARALEADTNRPKSSASSDSRSTDLTDLSTKVNPSSSSMDDTGEIQDNDTLESSHNEAESCSSALSSMSSKSDLTINQSSSNTQSHTTIVCQTYVNVVDCEKVSIQKQ